jgi:hypothetical protein
MEKLPNCCYDKSFFMMCVKLTQEAGTSAALFGGLSFKSSYPTYVTCGSTNMLATSRGETELLLKPSSQSRMATGVAPPTNVKQRRASVVTFDSAVASGSSIDHVGHLGRQGRGAGRGNVSDSKERFANSQGQVLRKLSSAWMTTPLTTLATRDELISKKLLILYSMD